jgi:hypothetical protein
MKTRLLPSLILCVIILFTAGCGVADAINNAVKMLQEVSLRIADESNDWRVELERALDLADSLPAEVRSLVKTELSATMTRAIATTSGELRCDIQFVNDLIRGDIQQIIAKLRKETVEPPDPTVCTVSPEQVDMSLDPNRRATINYFGYNMPLDPQDGEVKVELVQGDQVTDVSRHLNVASEFLMVLDLGGNGVPITFESDAIRLLWKDRRVSSIPIVQPFCETKEVTFKPANHTFRPQGVHHTRGDGEFDGNGPDIDVVLQLFDNTNRINGLLVFNAFERDDNGQMEGDQTTLRGIENLNNLYNPPSGWEVGNIIGSNQAAHSYRDTDHDLDIHSFASGPVREFRITGDTSGNDVGETGVEVVFQTIRITLRQTGNCVPR